MAKIIRWGLTDGYRLAQTVGKELENPSVYTIEEFIDAANHTLVKHPDEWVIYYALGDKYQQLGFYADALRVTKKCVELKPTDIRSVYALATTYNILTRASWSKNEEENSNLFKEIIRDLDIFDKRYSQAGLDHIGLAVETAAVQAIRWFERALQLKPDRESKAQIEQDLATLFTRFPHIIS